MSSWRRYSIYHRIVTVTILSFMVQAFLMAGITFTRYRSGMEQADATFKALMSKNEQRISAQFDSVRNIASSVGYSADVQRYVLNMTANERVENFQSIKYMFSLLINANPAIKAIYIASENGVFLEQGSHLTMFERFKMDYADAMKQTTFRGFFSKAYNHLVNKDDDAPYCIFYLPVNTLPSVQHARDAQFYCAVLFDMKALLEMGSEDTQNIEILTYDEQMLTASRRFSGMENLLAGADSLKNSVVVHADGRDYYMSSLDLNVDAPLRYTFIAPMDALMGDVSAFMQFSVIMITVCLIVAAALLVSMRNQIIRPIRQITQDMQQVADSSGIIRPTQAKELNIISSGINQMLHKLRDIQKQELVNKTKYYQMNLEKTQAEMLGYRSQINPHFLFNTLECMCSMARYHGIEPLENMILAMADSYRYVLRTPDFVTLSDEIAHIRNYMQIMDIRYPGRFQLQIATDEADCGQQVLSLILQPLVENAVLHGFVGYDKDEPCTIRVAARNEDGFLHIQVEDNGTGLSPELLEKVRSRMTEDHVDHERKHIALRNICRRLRFAYGEKGRVEIHSQEGQFTCIEIVIPIRQ